VVPIDLKECVAFVLMKLEPLEMKLVDSYIITIDNVTELEFALFS